MEYVSRYQSTGSLFASAFVLGAAVLFGSLFLAPNAAHAAEPTTFTTSFQDENTDGSIDRLVAVVDGDEALTSCSVDAGELATDWTVTGGGYAPVSLVSATCNTATRTITFVITAVADITGGVAAPTLAYDNDDANNSIANENGNLGAVGAVTATDAAGPVLISASPTSLKTGVRSTSSVVLTFSETPASITTSHSPTVVLTSSINSSVVTLTHAAIFLTGLNTLTISTAPDAATNPFAGAQTGDTTVASPLTFYVTSSGDDESADAVTYGVNLLTPEDGDSLEAGDMTDITWESDGGQASYVNLYYSEDAGTTWETIVTNTLNDGAYSWTTPHVDSDEVVVKVVTTDLADELATDTSGTFSLWFYSEDEDIVDSEEDGEDAADDEAAEEVPSEIDGVMAGDYIMVEGGSTIYYVDEYMMRRPFYDETTYFTYEDDFDAVLEVSADTLAEFTIGAPMLPKAGVVLVKIQSVAAVYMVEESSDGSYWLRWISSEDVAEEMFGASWSSYIIDVDVTLFGRYEMGDDVDEAEDVDTDMMKYRVDLHD